jgi:hypothetical protein
MRNFAWLGLVVLVAACGGDKNNTGADWEEPDSETPPDDGGLGGSSVPVDTDGDGFDESVDCDDLDAEINPHAFETCDGLDNDCDGEVDEGLIGMYYPDADGDGYGVDEGMVESCEAIEGMVTDGGDCDDTNPDMNPWALELCDEVDNDCNGVVDGEDALNPEFWFEDADGDGFGTILSFIEACSMPEGFIDNIDDCDDLNANIHPDAMEVCDGVDNDCDTLVDPNNAVDAPTWYRDNDFDSYGNPDDTYVACEPPTGYVSDRSDCEDDLPLVNPDGTETCNGLDDDCNGMTDEGFEFETYYRDSDGDLRGDPDGALVYCTRPADYVMDHSDCDDDNYWIHPDMPELCDGEDNDCDGVVDEEIVDVTYYPDADSDGFGDSSGVPLVDCIPPSGYVIDATDCDDGNAAINPGEVESCNGLDDDCDDELDEGLLLTTFYPDSDGDGFGVPGDTVAACDAPPGHVMFDTDCNDDEPTIYPGAYEMCNEIDDDCDDFIDDDCGSSPILGAYESAICDDVGGDINESGDYIAVHWNGNGTWSNGSALGFEIGDGSTYYESCYPGSPWQAVAFEWSEGGSSYTHMGNYSGSSWSYTTTCAGSVGDGETVAGAIHEWSAGNIEVIKTEIWEVEGHVSRVWFDVTNVGSDDVSDFDLMFGVDWDIDYGPSSAFATLNDINNEGDYDDVEAGFLATSEGPSTGRSAVYGMCDADNQVVGHAASWTTDDDFVIVDFDGASGDSTVHFGQRDMDIGAGESISFGFLLSVGEDVFEAVDAYVDQRDILCTDG